MLSTGRAGVKQGLGWGSGARHCPCSAVTRGGCVSCCGCRSEESSPHVPVQSLAGQGERSGTHQQVTG